ncbi:fimbrial biogenesis outer membrane usher protein [Lelliottia aquatilis]|uniref:fimbrial biogenesis usher protein n=1 Tax=Lelliottia aquatilis TaxID=2080838 RepID=UPI000CDE697E|nr:fimbrial biogenesis usher protein [Lelliottia aquatilis]POZ15136.1 fimbrial biogenesis outer membrane usher protein [Lelliottia aquatilis]
MVSLSHRYLSLAVLCCLYPVLSSAAEAPLEFDTSIMKDRGLDPSLGHYFAAAPKFTPGVKMVTVVVNGEKKGKVSATFGQDGQLCATTPFLQGASLVVPREVAKLSDDEKSNACFDYTKTFPGTVITPVPAQEELDLVVPQEAIDTTSEGDQAKDYSTGGTAGIFNYTAFATQNTSDSNSSETKQLMLEEGLNMHDWLFRSRQSLNEENGSRTTDNLYAYLQHTLVDSQKIFQAGQINTGGSIFAGTSISGVQIMPEEALSPEGSSGVSVSGIARSAQARVEVRQAGRVVYSTLVPAGPFTLNDVPIIRSNAELDVTVTETDGSKNHFVIPADAVNSHQLSSPSGLSAAVGRYRSSGDGESQPMLATLSDGWRVKPWLNIGTGIMTAQGYDAAAVTLDTLPFNKMLLSTTFKTSMDQKHGVKGRSSTLSASYALSGQLMTDVSMTRYTQGYRELEDSLEDNFQQYEGQYSAGVHYSLANLGSFSLRYAKNQGTEGNEGSEFVNASWGRSFGHMNLNVSWQRSVNQKSDDQDDDRNNSDDNGDMVFVNISMPLGGHRVSAYSHTLHHETNTGLQTSGDISQSTSYSLAAERDMADRENSFNGSINSNLHYTRLGLSAGTDGPDGRNYGVALSGGVVAHQNGVTFSPWPVKDTFAIIDAGKDLAGTRINTPTGDVWTDHWGKAIVPSVNPYHKVRVELDTNTLPQDVDVENGFSELATGRGAVGHVAFNTLHVHRAMIHVQMANGKNLKKGSTVVDGNGNYAATAVDNGLLFMEDISAKPELYLLDEDGVRVCQISYVLAKGGEKQTYENINGICK